MKVYFNSNIGLINILEKKKSCWLTFAPLCQTVLIYLNIFLWHKPELMQIFDTSLARFHKCGEGQLQLGVLLYEAPIPVAVYALLIFH